MSTGPARGRPFALGLAVAAVLVVAFLTGGLESPFVLHSLVGVYSTADVRSFSAAWQTGWARACDPNGKPVIYAPLSRTARRSAMIASMRVGDFGAISSLSAGGTAAGAASDAAYAAIVRGDWLSAARASSATPEGIPEPVWGTVLFLAGQQAFFTGDVTTSDQLLERSSSLVGEDGPITSTSLADCLSRWGRALEARSELRRAASQLPADDTRQLMDAFLPGASNESTQRLPATEAQPTFKLAARVRDGWSLVGADVNPDDIQRSPVLRTTVYWQLATQPEEVVIQRSVARNLVANGALEWDHSAPNVPPFGFTGSVYGNPVPVTVEQDSTHSHVLCIARPASLEGVGLQGPMFALSRTNGVILLEGGDAMSPAGGGFAIGAHWSGGSGVQYDYVGEGEVAPREWSTFVGVQRLPPGASSVQIWLLNVLGPAGARTCFDNMFMVELQPPD